MLREPVTNAEVLTGFSCSVVKQDAVVVHAATLVGGDTEPMPLGEGSEGERTFQGLIMTAGTVEQVSRQSVSGSVPMPGTHESISEIAGRPFLRGSLVGNSLGARAHMHVYIYLSIGRSNMLATRESALVSH